MTEKETYFDLSQTEEERAQVIHDESIVIDLLFHGPLSPDTISDEVSEKIKKQCKPYLDDPLVYYTKPREFIHKMALEGKLPEFKDEWDRSGITAGSRELNLRDRDSIIHSMVDVQNQFDHLDWLIKVKTVDDIYAAKENNLKAGIILAQETVGIGDNIDLLDSLYDFGLRVLQLTYNDRCPVGSGCNDTEDIGLTSFGESVVARMNKLGLVVDTGHCSKQTTLDACEKSTSPVIASHTGANKIHNHYRNKSDVEIKAIAKTGGVIGVYTMPYFLDEDENNTTIHHFLDHVDYIIDLVGIDHVGIGTDWPMTDTNWSLEYFKEHVMPSLGFKKGDGASTEKIWGLEKFSNFINITRGLVERGYKDNEIKKVLGENWIRVFKQVWK